jgi:hypothetical protein
MLLRACLECATAGAGSSDNHGQEDHRPSYAVLYKTHLEVIIALHAKLFLEGTRHTAWRRLCQVLPTPAEQGATNVQHKHGRR